MPGDAFLLFLMNDRPAHLFRKAVAGFPLHGNIGFILFIMVYLLIGRNTIQAPDPVSNQQIINSNNIGIAIMQGLAGSFGIVLSVPLTVLICTVLYHGKIVKKDC